MKKHIGKLGWLLSMLVVACATDHREPGPDPGTVTPQMRSGSTELRTYQLLDWIAPDDRTVVMSSLDRSLYKASFKRQCSGLRLVDTIAFIVQNPPQVEKYQGVVLPNGTRCAFTSITRLETTPTHGKDNGDTEDP